MTIFLSLQTLFQSQKDFPASQQNLACMVRGRSPSTSSRSFTSTNYNKSRRSASSIRGYQEQSLTNSIYGYEVEKSIRTQDLNKFYYRRINFSGLHPYRAYRRISLTPQQRATRLQWSHERRQWVDEWDHILFSDELRFCLWPNDGRIRIYVDIMVTNFAICLKEAIQTRRWA
jgi:hypothetical protein